MTPEVFVTITLSALNLLVLALTLGVLVWYAWDTHRIANQTVEMNIRPVVLRSGWILDWQVQSIEDVGPAGQPQFIQFTNLKNIAKDITGYIIIEGKKFALLFGSEITQGVVTDQSAAVTRIGFAPKWGWLPAAGKVYATFQREVYEEVSDPNQIYLSYKDMEGNAYFTKEDNQYSQTSGRS